MTSLRQSIPTEDALRQRLDEVWDERLRQHFFDLSPQRNEVLRFQRRALISFLLLLLPASYLFFSKDILGLELLTPIMAIAAVCLLVYFGFAIYELIKSRFAFALAFNRLLYPQLFSVLSLEVEYHSGIDESRSFGQSERRGIESADNDHNEVIKALQLSELLTERVERDTVDDIVKTTFADRSLSFNEIRSTRTEGSGKNRRTVTVFKGIFVKYELPRTLEGVTFISTEGDQSGFGHQDFWSRILGHSSVTETILEWNDFERDLHVAASNGTEARYVLTPDFMEGLYRWWSKEKRNIRLVFRGNTMCLLFPDRKIEIADATTSLREEKLKDYAMSVLLPAWHILRLIEIVNNRFRS